MNPSRHSQSPANTIEPSVIGTPALACSRNYSRTPTMAARSATIRLAKLPTTNRLPTRVDSVDESARTFTVHVEGGTFSNWIGTDQKRIFSVSGDELKYTNTSRSAGTGTALVVWRRPK